MAQCGFYTGPLRTSSCLPHSAAFSVCCSFLGLGTGPRSCGKCSQIRVDHVGSWELVPVVFEGKRVFTLLRLCSSACGIPEDPLSYDLVALLAEVFLITVLRVVVEEAVEAIFPGIMVFTRLFDKQ